ncbi:MAG: MBL fold metallo-hydrolase [Acidobacteriota bacterium]
MTALIAISRPLRALLAFPRHSMGPCFLALFFLGTAFATTLASPLAVPLSAQSESPPAPFLLVLGNAQDGGLPHPGCTRANCRRAIEDPQYRRSVASLAVVVPRAEGRPLRYLVDATPDLGRQLEALAAAIDGPREGGVDRQPVDGVFLTHAHIGHYLGLAYFGKETLASRDLPVWCTPAMAAFLRANEPWRTLVEDRVLDLRPLAPGESVVLGEGIDHGNAAADTDSEPIATTTAAGSVRVEAISVPHRDELSDTVGFRFSGPQQRVFYVPDTDSWERWDPPVEEILDEVDVALVDATFGSPDELPGRDLSAVPHPFATDSARRFAGAVSEGRLQVFFIHLNHSNPLHDSSSELYRNLAAKGFTVAQEGQRIPL